MKRIVVGWIAMLTMVCFFGLIPSNATDNPKAIFGKERHGVDNHTRTQNVRRGAGGTDGLNYSKENYTALAPSSGEEYSLRAEKVFYPYETIYLIDRYYIATAGIYTRYYIITDVVGTTVALDTVSFICDAPGDYWDEHTITFYTVGSYVYSSVTLGPGEWISSQQFSFIVE